jgi:hypothetical protein
MRGAEGEGFRQMAQGGISVHRLPVPLFLALPTLPQVALADGDSQPLAAPSARTMRIVFLCVALVMVLFIIFKWIYLLRKIGQIPKEPPPPRQPPDQP